MKHIHRTRRSFLFLQGPPGPFFWQLGQKIASHGSSVYRINLNGGDTYDWPGEATDYRGRASSWPIFFNRFLREHAITDLVLYGDCRPLHLAAHQLAKLRGVAIHVFEEGYIRPDWMTLEPDGVNGHSTLNRDPAALREAARTLPAVPDLPSITASFSRRARDSYWYYHRVVTGRLRFPFYRSHRRGVIVLEGFGWMRKFALARLRSVQAGQTLSKLADKSFYLFPLQLTGDYQIREHSPFGTMYTAADYVLDSFAHRAPAHTHLLVKEHPLDCGFHNWRRFLQSRARALGIEDRVHHIDGGELAVLARRAKGMVCVNSTSGTLALTAGKPVIVLGEAIYDVPGITHQGHLDEFWEAPAAPDMELFDAFRRVLHQHCLVRGGLASESATETLIDNSFQRLMGDPQHAIPDFEKISIIA
ncbi:capsule biosynthesis protein [Sphingomonas sp. HT-1]|uniref:capsule biosynthesis protein n=1 Tax=unclassified Sphingomonas TaxID=196159 RepID=UPI00030686FE|nr:capsular biosynthesis protein [Sphingomonas sp. ATCC 31555]KTF68386.1 capsular biosynthesis protein [Sphingomonas sp. WG]